MSYSTIKRILIGLLVSWAVGLAARSVHAQPLELSGTHEPNYANASAPYSEANPWKKPHTPFAPVQFEPAFQPFAPAETSEFGNGPRPKIGFFASYERLAWSLSKPARADIGDPNQEGYYLEPANQFVNVPPIFDGIPNPTDVRYILETNGLDTGFFQSKLGWGNRWEFGYMDVDNKGWLVGVLDHVAQLQPTWDFTNVTVLFDNPRGFLDPMFYPTGLGSWDADLNGNDWFGRFGVDTSALPDGVPDFGIFWEPPPTSDLPPTARIYDPNDKIYFIPRFENVTITNRCTLNGVEIMRTYRAPRLHNGGNLEMMYGARFFQLDDRFSFSGSGGVLDSTSFKHRALNNIVGPQIGARYYYQRGHWITSTELRFTAGCDFQNFQQEALVASTAGYVVNDSGEFVYIAPNPGNGLRAFQTKNTLYQNTFAPIGEIRFNATYQPTRTFGVKIGYTAVAMGGVARASNTIHWSVPDMGFLNDNDDQFFIAQGLTFGIEVNR